MKPLTRDMLEGKSADEIDLYHHGLTKKLSEEKLRFCELMASGVPAGKARDIAGVQPTVKALLRSRWVQDAIVLFKEMFSRRANISQDWRKNILKDIAEKCLEDGKESISVAALRELNQLEAQNRQLDSMESGVNAMIASLSIPINGEMALLSKLFHQMNYHSKEVKNVLEGELLPDEKPDEKPDGLPINNLEFLD